MAQHIFLTDKKWTIVKRKWNKTNKPKKRSFNLNIQAGLQGAWKGNCPLVGRRGRGEPSTENWRRWKEVKETAYPHVRRWSRSKLTNQGNIYIPHTSKDTEIKTKGKNWKKTIKLKEDSLMWKEEVQTKSQYQRAEDQAD